MGISFSNIGTVGREQLITSGGNGEQNWSYIPSKGKSTKKANNRAYQFADEKTKKQIAYMLSLIHILSSIIRSQQCVNKLLASFLIDTVTLRECAG